METSFAYLLDERNTPLWIELKSHYNIRFEFSTNNEYACFSKDNDAVFHIVKSNPCKDSFTHEMLHVYLRRKGCFIGAGLKMTIAQSRILTSIFSFALLEHIGNCLDHVKMLPLYLELGFTREKFLLDYHLNKCTPEDLISIKKNYKSGRVFNPIAVDNFIGKYFAMAADPNPALEYSQQMKALSKIDPLLYQILKQTWENWKAVKLTFDADEIMDYHPILSEFYENLKKWISKNSVP